LFKTKTYSNSKLFEFFYISQNEKQKKEKTKNKKEKRKQKAEKQKQVPDKWAGPEERPR
jgi:hypothetical protein